MVMGGDGFPQVLQSGDTLTGASSAITYANPTIPAGNTVTATVETAFASKLTIPAGTLVPGTTVHLYQFGVYTSTGLTPTITARIRLGGVSVLPARVVMGLLGDTNAPWIADATIIVMGASLVATGVLTLADNQVRIYGQVPIAGPNTATALDLTSSAQWGQTGCAITCQGWMATITPPAS